jgi:C4-dicarboxylate transporter DctQ subunit
MGIIGKQIEKFVNAMNLITTISAVICCAIIFFIVFLQVVSRYIFNYSFIWVEEHSVFAMIWMAFLGAGVLVKRWGHISLSVLLLRVGLRTRIALLILIKVFAIVFMIFLTYYGLLMVFYGRHRYSVSLGYSTQYLKLMIPIGAIVMGVNFLFLLWKDIENLKKGNLEYFNFYIPEH